ncbi:TIGR01457 family HAD-type hydrolase [Balamuthia mandrillaris]
MKTSSRLCASRTGAGVGGWSRPITALSCRSTTVSDRQHFQRCLHTRVGFHRLKRLTDHKAYGHSNGYLYSTNPHTSPSQHSSMEETTGRDSKLANNDQLAHIRSKRAFIVDMDGVLYHGKKLLHGAKEFVNWLQEEKKDYLFLTNSSDKTQKELSYKLSNLGIKVDESRFYTSALSTASFLHSQKPFATAYVVGDPGLLNALYNEGVTITDISPDYVVVGETTNYNYEALSKAINLVRGGARLIGTNCDLVDRTVHGLAPAGGTLVAPIVLATGVDAYFLGKPNPLIMRSAMDRLGSKREDTIIIGDRMDTDIIAGIESGIDTCLVLTGVTSIPQLRNFAYAPKFVLEGVSSVPPSLS